ncbi:MAG TPA: family 16 glycosylhydrolase, partial [Tepidisphaeraceae bacterium]|nr:family 16 glycosylhydrolase [Tepidisphaeraceae bacterium]
MLLAGLSASPAAALPAGTWQYLWGDEFTLNSLDTLKWSYGKPWNPGQTDPANVVFGDGALTLLTRRTSSGFTDTYVTTGYNRFTFSGGYVEARILLPNTPGSWPAFWGLYTGWPPEADIMEYPLSTDGVSGLQANQYNTAWHYRNSSGGNSAGAGVITRASDLRGSYHTFGMEWRENDWVGFYFDGQLVSQFGDDSAISQMLYMYLLLSYGAGGWPGTPSLSQWPIGHTDQMKVDWVRVWKQAGTRSTDWIYTGSEQYVQWDSPGNWSNGVPNLGGVTANFSTIAGVAEQRLDWSGIRTLTAINLDGSTRYRLGWSDDRLILAGANNASGNAALTVAATSSTDHHIAAELELFSTLAISNASNQPLTLSGRIFGIGGIVVDGPGVVVFAHADNAYLGNTTIDGGPQGPAVVRVAASNPFGTGAVVIGAGGNATTARLELSGNCTVPNTIHFNGRNNNSAGIRNVSGHNTLAGTISLQSGGSVYWIDAAAGTLSLTGTLSSAASGLRVVRLGGDGNGLISGVIQDGNATLGIVKDGAGGWTISAANTYTGGTTVNDGVLVANKFSNGTLTVNGGVAQVSVKGTANSPSGTTRVPALNVSTTARLDLNNNALVVNNGNLGTITSRIKSALENNGNFDWQGPGIGSTQANVQNTTAGSFLFGLGVIKNDLAQVGGTGPIYTDFAGESGLTAAEVLVKFTYFGDADLSGSIDATDYSLIDNGYVNTLSGWLNGDFDYSGTIDATDYALIDNAYVNQAGPLAEALIAQHSQQFGGEYVAALRAVQSGVIPEP